MTDFEPQNDLERALVETRSGTLPVKVFLGRMLSSDLAIPTKTEPKADGEGMSLLVYDREGVSRVAVFTDPTRATVAAKHAPYLLTMNAYHFLRTLPAEYGLVLNPGYPVGFEMPPEGVVKLVEDFSA